MSQIEATTQLLPTERGLKLFLHCDQVRLTYHDVIELWRTDRMFCTLFNDLLASSGFEAFFWETPPVSMKSRFQEFECVLLDAPSLVGRSPDGVSFREQFSNAMSKQVVVVENLGGDARLIVPCPKVEEDVYSHLASFVRKAPREQQQLWHEVGDRLSSAIGTAPIWLSTSGLGVMWLHITLDCRPKYYTFSPYRQVLKRLESL